MMYALSSPQWRAALTPVCKYGESNNCILLGESRQSHTVSPLGRLVVRIVCHLLTHDFTEHESIVQTLLHLKDVPPKYEKGCAFKVWRVMFSTLVWNYHLTGKCTKHIGLKNTLFLRNRFAN